MTSHPQRRFPWRFFRDAAWVMLSVTHSVTAFPWRCTGIAFHDAFPWRHAPRCFHDAFRDTFFVTLSRCWFPWRLSMTLHRCCFPWHYPWQLFHDIPKVLHSVIADVFGYTFRDDYSVTLHKYRFAFRLSMTLHASQFPWRILWRLFHDAHAFHDTFSITLLTPHGFRDTCPWHLFPWHSRDVAIYDSIFTWYSKGVCVCVCVCVWHCE